MIGALRSTAAWTQVLVALPTTDETHITARHKHVLLYQSFAWAELEFLGASTMLDRDIATGRSVCPSHD